MTIFTLNERYTTNMNIASHAINRPIILKNGHIGEELLVYDLITRDWIFKTSRVRDINEVRDFDGTLRGVSFRTGNSVYAFNVVAQDATLI